MARPGPVVSDEALLEACRAGDTSAFSEVWERHHRAGRVAARNLAPSLDADDLVAEAYLKILELVTAGNGPRGAFRPYLYQTIRTIAADQLRSPEQSHSELDQIPDLTMAGPWEDNAFDLNATRQAFGTLNERWQSVLWYTEVEGMPPRAVAPLLGISANSVSALSIRAREALQSAWVEAHVNTELAEAQCRATLEQLQRFQRGKLTARASREVSEHLETCNSCAAAAREYRVLNAQLALVLAGLFLGGSGALAFLQAYGPLAGGATASSAASMLPVGISASPGAGSSAAATPVGSGAAASSGMSVGATVLTVAASLAVAVAVAAGIVVAVNSADQASFTEVGDAILSEDRAEQSHDSSAAEDGKPDTASQDPAQDGEYASDSAGHDASSTVAEISRPGQHPQTPPAPTLPGHPAPIEPPEPPTLPTTPPTTPPSDPGDPSVHTGYDCLLSGVAILGDANEYGVIRLRASEAGHAPIELLNPIYDPIFEGIEPGNVFVGGIFSDPYGNTYDFGFFSGTDPAPGYGWFGPDPSTLPQWSLEFGTRTVHEVKIEIRLVTPDNRRSPWVEVDPGVTC